MSMGGAPVAQAMEEALPYKGEGTSVNALAQGGGGGGKDREKRRGGREEGRKASSLTLSLRPSVPPDLGPLPAAGGDYTPQADQWEDHCFYTHSHHSSLRPSVPPSLQPLPSLRSVNSSNPSAKTVVPQAETFSPAPGPSETSAAR